LQESVVHASESLQSRAAWVQAPVAGSHVSSVQASASSQEGVCAQPVCESQESVVHRFASSQSSAAPDTQAPSAHASSTVQASLSSHGRVLFTETQLPLASTQLSVVHTLPSSAQTFSGPGVHTPSPSQTSGVKVQAFSSSQVVLSRRLNVSQTLEYMSQAWKVQPSRP
jgi:hypothetical protein